MRAFLCKVNVIRLISVLFWASLGIFCLYIPTFFSQDATVHSLNVLVMPNLIDASLLSDFEQDHNLKVNITYAESNEEIIMKMRATHGFGYDLIMVSDYAVPDLVKEQLIQKIDTSRLPFFKDIYPELLHHPFDPLNEYSVPYYWGVYGFGIDANYFDREKAFDWNVVFNVNAEKNVFKIGMRESAREIILMAAFYLFGRIDSLQKEDYEKVKELLIAQKPSVLMYADERLNNLLVSQECPLVVTISGDIAHTVRRYSNVEFVIPASGSFINIDSFVMPIASDKVEQVHEFLSYIYRKDILEGYIEIFDFSPPLKTIDVHPTLASIAVPTVEMFSNLLFFDVKVPSKIIDEIMIALKTAF